MIEAVNLTKRFDNIVAVDNINAQIRDGSVFGLIGTNGAGKSTFLRMAAGVLRPDDGTITIDGMEVFENEEAKKRFFYISDDQYFFSNSTPRDMMSYYRIVYPSFDKERFHGLMHSFGLDESRKINTFSKGMKKQVSVICGVCAGTDYLFCDETFDGLDPVMRQGIKSIFAKEIDERELTPIIASHNLRELEDICDHIGLLHRGGVLLSKELADLKCNMHKVQCVFPEDAKVSLYKLFHILQLNQKGRLITMTVRENEEDIAGKMEGLNPVYYEVLPLSLEEIFISETEVVGYDIKNLIY